MKKLSLASLVAAALLAWCGCQTASNTPHGKVVVIYDHPEKFTDVQSAYTNGTEQGYLDDLGRFLDTHAGPHVPVGQTLTMTFTDIDMAGQIGMNPRASDVRVIRSNYPVRILFSYAITDAAGKVVQQGKEELVNNFPAAQMGLNKSDPLFHEKDELDGWIRRTLK